MKVDRVIIRKSPVHLVFRLIVAFAVAGLVIFMVEDSFMDSSVSFLNLVELELSALVILVLLQAVISFFLVISWARNYYEVKPEEVVHRYGIFFSREKRYVLRNIEKIDMEQGILGKLMSYGTVRLTSPLLKDKILLNNVSDPVQVSAYLDDAISDARSDAQIVPLPQ